MAYVTIPKDIINLKTKVMFNLTKRQLICFAIGIGIGFLLYFTLKAYDVPVRISTLCMMALMSPFFLLALYEKNGRTIEIVLKDMYEVKFLNSKERPYIQTNLYRSLEKQYNYNKEIENVVKTTKTTQTNTRRKKANSRNQK